MQALIETTGTPVELDLFKDSARKFLERFTNWGDLPVEEQQVLEVALEQPAEEEPYVEPWVFDTDPHYFPEPDMRTRRYVERSVEATSGATHTCGITPNVVNLYEAQPVEIFINIHVPDSAAYSLEIGSLPIGFNALFSSSKTYTVPIFTSGVTSMMVVREIGSEVGDFTFPVIFSRHSEPEEYVICQINVVAL